MKHKLLDWVLKDERRRAWMAEHGLGLVVGMISLASVVWTLLILRILEVLS